MIQNEHIQTLQNIMDRKMANLPKLVRPWTVEYTQGHSIPNNLVLTGQRGTGKSTFLLYHSKFTGKRILYFSADNPLVITEPLYSVAEAAFMQGYGGIIIDEVHMARNWSLHLKSLYDNFPDRLIWASDSSSLILRKGVADLSRRYVFVHMPILSFREFLFLETEKLYPACNPFSDEYQLPLKPSAEIITFFELYKMHGTRPFYQEGNFEERSLAVLDKTINSDVPFFVPHITDDNLRLMSAMIGTLAKSPVPRVHVRNLCADWGVSADKLYQLLEVMEAVGAVRIVRFENDKKAKTAGAKLFFADPCLYSVLRGNVGTMRESFVTALLEEAGYEVCAARDEHEGDFVVSRKYEVGNKIKIEVGGERKTAKQSDFVVRDNCDYPSDKVIPLWLLAMMW